MAQQELNAREINLWNLEFIIIQGVPFKVATSNWISRGFATL